MTLRHDAKECRSKARSETIRIGLGILTPEERQKREEAEQKRMQAQSKREAKGISLFEEDCHE